MTKENMVYITVGNERFRMWCDNEKVRTKWKIDLYQSPVFHRNKKSQWYQIMAGWHSWQCAKLRQTNWSYTKLGILAQEGFGSPIWLHWILSIYNRIHQQEYSLFLLLTIAYSKISSFLCPFLQFVCHNGEA